MKLGNNIYGDINLLGTVSSAKNIYYDSSISGLSTDNVQTAIDLIDSSLDSVYSNTFGTETVSRTIYVETTGSDETGDGLTVGTAFATIGKALSTVKKNILSGITITIQVGIGTFSISDSDINILSLISGSGTLVLQGTLTLVDSGFTIGAAEVDDPLTFAVSGGNSATWTEDQWKWHFLKSGSNYFPITNNSITGPTISRVAVNTSTEIYQIQTVINCPSYIVAGVILNFNYLELVITGNTLISTVTSDFNKTGFTLKACYIRSISTYYMQFNGWNQTVSNSIFNNVRVIAAERLRFYQNYVNFNGNDACLNLQEGDTNYQQIWGNVFENPNTGSSSCAMLLVGRYVGATYGLVNPVYQKFQNCNCIFRVGTIIYEGNPRDFLVIKNCNYFMKYGLTNVGDYTKIQFNIGSSYILNTPVIRWFYNPMYEFVNLSSGRNIQIKDLIYPEIDVNQSKNLTNNTITPIIIGDVSQNISCKIDYTINRGSGFRSGNFNIISDVSNSYITPDVFGTNFDLAVDASAISFSTDISNGKYIMMNVTQNDSTDASLFYNVSRVMRTPIIM